MIISEQMDAHSVELVAVSKPNPRCVPQQSQLVSVGGGCEKVLPVCRCLIDLLSGTRAGRNDILINDIILISHAKIRMYTNKILTDDQCMFHDIKESPTCLARRYSPALEKF